MSVIEWVNDDGTTEELGDPIEEEVAQRPQKGTCKVCGQPARSLTSTVCDEHDGRRSKSSSSGTRRSSSSGRQSTKAPSADELTNKVFGKVFVGITFVMAMRMVSAKGIHDSEDEIADHLSMTQDEATSIAHPFARLAAGTTLNKKFGRKTIENVDVFDAIMAFWDWQKRVQKFVNNPNFNGQLRIVNADANSKGGGDEQTDQPFTANGYANVSGSHFID